MEGRLPPRAVRRPAHPRRAAGGQLTDAGVVVAGGGLAGARTCAELRAAGYQEPITLLCGEPHLPYDRPPLSKGLLLGRVADPTLPEDLAGLGVDVRIGVRAERISDRVVEAGGERLPFTSLVVATGARPVRLPVGRGSVLRTVEDARGLRAALTAGAALAVVGAGWIGAEVASAARELGCVVTVVEAMGGPVFSALGGEVSALLARWWAAAGVRLLTGRKVAAVEEGSVPAVRLDDGTVVEADIVLVAVGVVPDVDWVAGSGVRCERGVVVDGTLRSDRPDVLAVGDAARWWSARYGRHLSLGHWDDALRGPVAVAASITGRDRPHDPMPYVWSEQFGRYLQLVGLPEPGQRTVVRGSPAARPGPPGWSICWLGPGGRLAAVLAVDRPRDLLQGRRLLEASAVVDPALLADPARPLRACAVDG